MRVLITGAGGNLGRAAIPVLERVGHELRLFDFRELATDHESVTADIRDASAVEQAMRGVDAVIHAAALHGIHSADWSDHDFWSINATGTFLVYDAAWRLGVRHIVLASSMAVYGVGAGAANEWPVVTETDPLNPADFYGLTKVVAETTARFHAAQHQINTVALRLGMFVPETFERYGFRLLFGGVDDRDVGEAVGLALTNSPPEHFAAFNIMCDNGIDGTVAADLAADLPRTLDRLWPGTTETVREKGASLDQLIWGGVAYSTAKARSELGLVASYDFAAFLDAWRSGRVSHYPFADEPWWGAERPNE